ncbi:ATP-dependent RNA helicase SUPV3L1/SUV3 [Paucimonas lemoignei]|uniref:ATP-dependent RNA helicase SUPV3L1/SUV3 n=1 Tax=Paucimonas lemoignei TaxID=29443 RepID=A0A4R3HQC1_PAULE|nr:helicase-related protein [Paucimonas lemoignei]TCS33776.1 ATP-dependent RNA helicase SUPV3L1/SUV3 [Paucimonas lemoignei]
MSTPFSVINPTPADDPAGSSDTPEAYAQRLGAELLKLEGAVVVRFSGIAELGELRVPYALVPSRGVLAKPSKWRKLGPEGQLELVQERVHPDAMEELRRSVVAFVGKIAAESEDAGLDTRAFLSTLADAPTAVPAPQVFERIEQRLTHAIERQQEERHAALTRESINLAEYPASFEVARRMPRRFIALLGPTNSGKTHQAMEALTKAKSGMYLAPLRLLALENYERLRAARPHGKELKVNLITGEERRIEEGATHVASTVEMLDPHLRVEVAVIDEIQMLADRDRGAAWTAAVCGAPAHVVYLVGSLEARRAVEALAERLEIPLEVHVLKRKAPLTMEAGPVKKMRNLRRGDAVIAFSRRDVLMWRDLIAEHGFSVATIYGNLSPEVRQAQAARFRDGTADIVVGTDAIAMGLNLPIERVVMTTYVKFNGVDEEEIPIALARQIAGRAGRFGVHEEGFVAGFDDDTHYVMRSLMKEKIPPVPAAGFAVAPSIEHLHRIASVTGEQSLTRLFKRFVHNIDVPDGFFYPRITEEQAERALWLDTLALSVADKFTLSLVPISSRIPYLHNVWENWARALAKRKVCTLQRDPHDLARQNLQEVEDTCRMYSAYAWLSFRIPEYFPDGELAHELAREASERVDAMLQAQNAALRRRHGRRAR